MPQRKNAVKRLRQDKKIRVRNLKHKNELKKTIKQFNSLIKAANLEEAEKFLKQLASKIDRAVFKKIINKNKASRLKSRLSRKLNRSA